LYCTQAANSSQSAGSVFISQVFPGAGAKSAPNFHQSGMRVLQWNTFSTFALGDVICAVRRKKADSKQALRFESAWRKEILNLD
jgi:hypothetical protein